MMDNSDDTGNEWVCMMLEHQKYANEVAISSISKGYPNKYIGNPGIINDLNYTPLTTLAGCFDSNTYELVEWALKKGCDPNLPQYNGNPGVGEKFPLEFSIENGDIKSIEILIRYGANVSKIIDLDEAMFYMILQGTGEDKDYDERFIKTFKFILDHGANREATVGGSKNIDLLKERWEGNRLKKAKLILTAYNTKKLISPGSWGKYRSYGGS